MRSDYVKSKMKINRRLQTEYLLNNIIDKEFQSMLFPMSFVPFLFLMSHFIVINNFITPESRVSSYIKSFIGSIILVLSHVFRFYYYTEAFKSFTSDVVVFLLYFDLIFFSIISILNHIISSSQRSNAVELIIKLQHVLNSIKIDKVEFLSKHKNRNWYTVLMVFSVYVFHWVFGSRHITFLNLVIFILIYSDMRKTCKNVLRLNRASLRKMSAFGVFELDATFPLRLLNVLVTYCVVLLQFAFLSS
ncbi:uncharacterized protein LOC134751243 [Cydia strobilella]|uniref:uncharacterized protein LOC134751243 n=1 Tax=Cydia strobilella TaxID=1100964 RepID=UPI003004FC42